MASFCQQCSLDVWGKDRRDFVGLTKEEDQKRGFYCFVICESCGPTYVDKEGKCVGKHCYENHASK